MLKWVVTTWLKNIWWNEIFKKIKYLPNMCWNGKNTMILYMKQYTWKHVMTVKSFIVGIGLNGNKFMSNINLYSLKQKQYISHGNWYPNFLHSLGNNCKLHEWQNHNWFDVNTIVMYYHKSSKALKHFNKR